MEAGAADAPPLLLLHGVGANAMHWRFQFAGLSDRFRVIAWNAPGYMLSDNLVTEAPEGRDYADAFVDFLDIAGVDPLRCTGEFVWVAYRSMRGMVSSGTNRRGW